MHRFGQAAAALWISARHPSLTWEMAKREILGRYRGASLGLIWALLGPLLMVVVYTIAFGGVLKARWPTVGDSPSNFTLILFVGLIVHALFAETLTRGPTLVTGNPNYVKRIIFPLELLPWPMLLSALFHLAMNFAVFAGFHLILVGPLPWTVVLTPLVLVPAAVLLLGLALFLSALGVYFRDITQVMGPLATAMLFLSSAIIPVDSLPDQYRTVFELNPLTFIIDQVRNVALWGVLPDWVGLGRYLAASLGFAFAGSLWFQSTRRGFADVL